jgi:hypothetical protein
MSDKKSDGSPDQSTEPNQPDGQSTVEIDLRRRVGIGGGVDSFRHKVDDLEER